MLLALVALGALLLGPLLLLLGFGTAFGSDVAGWLLAFTLLLATFGAVWTARRAARLIRAREDATRRPVRSRSTSTVAIPWSGDETKWALTARGCGWPSSRASSTALRSR